jgi:transposase
MDTNQVPKKHSPLKDEEIALIIEWVSKKEPTNRITHRLNRNENTIRTFIRHFHEKPIFKEKRGMKSDSSKINPGDLASEGNKLTKNPFLSLRQEISQENTIIKASSLSTLRVIRHESNFNFYKTTSVPLLNASHIEKRLNFCCSISSNDNLPPIIFTDESFIFQNTEKGGIWRPRGQIPKESFFSSEPHPLHAMVLGGIGPNGLKTRLIQCPKSVNSKSYLHFLAVNNIVYNINQTFGEKRYLFQEDNAPAHKKARKILDKFVNRLEWSPKSPDLSPIEQIWVPIKSSLKGIRFANVSELFNAINSKWMNIPNDLIENFHSSFRRRCQVCFEISGQCLNGH